MSYGSLPRQTSICIQHRGSGTLCIPDGYWDQFRGREIDILSSPNPYGMAFARLAIKPTIINHEAPFLEIRYEVYGRRIRVAQVTGEVPE